MITKESLIERAADKNNKQRNFDYEVNVTADYFSDAKDKKTKITKNKDRTLKN